MDNLLASMAMYITAMFGYDVSSSYIPIPVIATFIFLTTIISFTYAYDFICDETSITYRDLLATKYAHVIKQEARLHRLANMKENRQQLRRQRRLAKVIQSVLYGCCLIGHTHNISSKFPPFGQLDNAVQVQDQTTSQSSNTTSDPPIQSYQFQEAPPPTDIQYDDGGDISQSTFQNNSEWSGQVFYTDLDGEIKVINDIESSYTISQIKYEIWSTSGIPPTQLMIKYGGRILDSTRSLSSYHIQEGSCFQLQLRLRGGSGATKAEDDYEAVMEDTDDINNNEEAATIANSINRNGIEQDLEPVVGTADTHGGTADNDGEGIAASSSMASTQDDVVSETLSNEQIIDEIERICNKQFPHGKRFPTSEALKSELTALGQKWGFGISVSGRQLPACGNSAIDHVVFRQIQS